MQWQMSKLKSSKAQQPNIVRYQISVLRLGQFVALHDPAIDVAL